eukprot:12551578-Prorocentrum_lima.AAC.1
MTSSLVGSEMCIRDRRKFALTCPSVMSRQGVRSWYNRNRAATWYVDAVSYTHLTLPTICSV